MCGAFKKKRYIFFFFANQKQYYMNMILLLKMVKYTNKFKNQDLHDLFIKKHSSELIDAQQKN